MSLIKTKLDQQSLRQVSLNSTQLGPTVGGNTRFPDSHGGFFFVKSKLYTHNLSSQGLLCKQNPSVLRKFILHEQVTMHLR